jgi:thiol-disulfide isomerase/thioredoxin
MRTGRRAIFATMKKLIVTVVLLAAVALSWAQQARPTYKTNKAFPAFNLLDIDSKRFVSNTAFPKGNPLVLVYFSPLCAHCMAFTDELTKNLKAFKGVNFLMVTAYSPEDMKAFVTTRGLHKMPAFKVGSDIGFSMGEFYEVKEIPCVFVYNKQGKLTHQFPKEVKVEEIQAALQKG